MMVREVEEEKGSELNRNDPKKKLADLYLAP